MEKAKETTVKIERKTFVRGNLWAKYIGYIDENISSPIHESIYDLEFLEATVSVLAKDIRRWDQGGEFEEFKT